MTDSSSSAGHGRKEGNFVTVMEDRFAVHVFVVDRGGGHRGVFGEPWNLSGDVPPEVGYPGTVGQLASLFALARGVAKAREIQQVHPHREPESNAAAS